MTRKAPTGAKHASCLDHIEYGAVTKSGWLCISTTAENRAWPPLEIARPDGGAEGPYIPRGAVARDMQPVDRAADMRAFVDHVATVAAAARVRELARRDVPAITAAEYAILDPVPDVPGATMARYPRRSQGSGSHLPYVDAETIALAADLDARKGRAVRVAVAPVVETPAPVVVAPAKVARVRKVAPAKVAGPVAVVVDGVTVAESRHVDISAGPAPEPVTVAPTGAPGLVRSVYHVTAYASHGDREAGRISYDATYSDRAAALQWREDSPYPVADVVAEPWRELAAEPTVTVAEYGPAPEPGQRNDDGEPDARGTAAAHDFGLPCDCGRCLDPDVDDPEPEPVAPIVREVRRGPADTAADMLAGPGWILARADAVAAGLVAADAVAVEPAAVPSRCWQYLYSAGGPRRCLVEPDYHDGPHEYPPRAVETPAPEPEPIAAPAPVMAAVQPATRPTCPRCGQTFRLKGTGLAWHLANRPDCAPARLSVAV